MFLPSAPFSASGLRRKSAIDKRLYVPAPDLVPPELQPLIGGRIDIRLIRENWPDILRLAASMAAGTVVPSQSLRKLAAYPRQNSLALALREVGRLERSIFMLDWLSDIDLQRRVQIGFNKGEATVPSSARSTSTGVAKSETGRPRDSNTELQASTSSPPSSSIETHGSSAKSSPTKSPAANRSTSGCFLTSHRSDGSI